MTLEETEYGEALAKAYLVLQKVERDHGGYSQTDQMQSSALRRGRFSAYAAIASENLYRALITADAEWARDAQKRIDVAHEEDADE